MENERYKRFNSNASTIEIAQALERGCIEIDVWEYDYILRMEADEAIKMALNILKVCNYEGETK